MTVSASTKHLRDLEGDRILGQLVAADPQRHKTTEDVAVSHHLERINQDWPATLRSTTISEMSSTPWHLREQDFVDRPSVAPGFNRWACPRRESPRVGGFQ